MKIKDTTLPMNNLPTPMARSVKNASKKDIVSFLGSFGYWGFGVLRYDNLLMFFYFKVRIRENEKNLKVETKQSKQNFGFSAFGNNLLVILATSNTKDIMYLEFISSSGNITESVNFMVVILKD